MSFSRTTDCIETLFKRKTIAPISCPTGGGSRFSAIVHDYSEIAAIVSFFCHKLGPAFGCAVLLPSMFRGLRMSGHPCGLWVEYSLY